MRIEISAGSIGISVNDFQIQYQTFLSNTESVVSSFKTIKNEVWNLNGGIGNLQDAMDDVENRICTEEHAKDSAFSVMGKTDDFLSLVNRIDRQLCDNIERNREELYDVHPWLRPEITEDEKQWYESAWDWLCDRSEVIGNGLKRAWDWTKDTCVKFKDGLIEFYQEHKKVIDTIVVVLTVVVAVAAVIGSGSWALAPFLIFGLGVPQGVALTISSVIAVTAVVSSITSGILNIVDIWAEVDDPIYNMTQCIFNKISLISNFAFSIGNIYNLKNHFRIVKYKTGGVSKRIIQNDEMFKWTPENLMRMKDGHGPIGADGKTMELHHLLQKEDSGIIELPFKLHRGKGNYKFWHTTDKTIKSVVDHGKGWREFTTGYWEWRANQNFNMRDNIIKILTFSDMASETIKQFVIDNYVTSGRR